jgi:hypothetical protein
MSRRQIRMAAGRHLGPVARRIVRRAAASRRVRRLPSRLAEEILMSSFDISATTASQLTSLFKSFDVINDNQLSNDEFATMLSRVFAALASGSGLRGVGSSARAAGSNESASNAAASDEPVTYHPLAGFDTGRLNNPNDVDPKYVFGRWAYQKTNGGAIPLTGDMVREFVANDPRWEIDPFSSAEDPKIRVKQQALDSWKPGVSIYQDVITDSGGRGAISFYNVIGDPARGYQAANA